MKKNEYLRLFLYSVLFHEVVTVFSVFQFFSFLGFVIIFSRPFIIVLNHD